jgi:hypothetical protein
VPTAKHGMRRLYAVESTQPLFEDFGSAWLENGQATVRLDPIFAATVNTATKYHVCEAKKIRGSKPYLANHTDTAQGSLPRGSAERGGGDFCAAVRRGDACWTGHEQRSLIISGEPILPPFNGGLFRATARRSWALLEG